jgi:uncharacterized ion transporter superfamily protein YfcC
VPNTVLKKVPDVFVIVFCLIIFAAILTWILPGGSFERRQEEINGHPRQVLVQGSFEFREAVPQTFSIVTAPLKGFIKLADIIVFIFIVGGAFFILNESGSIAAGTQRLVVLLKGREFLIIPIVMTFFSFFGAAFGMCEEAMPFALIFVPLALALGYDSIVGVCMTFLAAGVGFAGAFLNPFTLQIAQGLAGLQPVSGWEYRVVVWLIATGLTITWVMIYAARIKRDPTRSPMFELDKKRKEEIEVQTESQTKFNIRHGLCLAVLAATIGGMIFGVIELGWYIVELGGLFLAMGLLSGIISGMGLNQLAKAFVSGVKEMAGAALIVGFAGGILVVLEEGGIMDTILYGMGQATSQLPAVLAADAMYVVQLTLNFFIPSGSTKAALTMPLMAPLADLSGITRQTAVLAYQLGDGFTNMIIPTSGVTVGTLAMAKIPFEKWFRWSLPLQLTFFVLSILLLIWPVLTGWE